LTDNTTGAVVTSTESCPAGSTCLNSSAETITEDPGGGVPGGYNLADFGMSNFTATRAESSTGLSEGLEGTSQWTSTNIIMEDPSDKIMATPSGLYNGRGFNVTWNSAT